MKKKHQMDIETANQTLQNVFAACNHKPNSIPIETILSQRKVNTGYVSVCMWVCIAFLIAVLLSPIGLYQTNFHISSLLSISDFITIEEHSLTDDCFTMKLKGDNIDYDKISMMDDGGTVILPDEIIPEEQIIRIYHPSGTLNIYIPDKDGHTLLAVLTVDKDE